MRTPVLNFLGPLRGAAGPGGTYLLRRLPHQAALMFTRTCNLCHHFSLNPKPSTLGSWFRGFEGKPWLSGCRVCRVRSNAPTHGGMSNLWVLFWCPRFKRHLVMRTYKGHYFDNLPSDLEGTERKVICPEAFW